MQIIESRCKLCITISMNVICMQLKKMTGASRRRCVSEGGVPCTPAPCGGVKTNRHSLLLLVLVSRLKCLLKPCLLVTVSNRLVSRNIHYTRIILSCHMVTQFILWRKTLCFLYCDIDLPPFLARTTHLHKDQILMGPSYPGKNRFELIQRHDCL